MHEVLRTTLDENLRMIGASSAYLKAHTDKFIYDAEHFFDGYKTNADYALATLKTAADNGADALVLCDTNGGSMYWEVGEIVRTVRRYLDSFGYRGVLGIHTHNDGDVGVQTRWRRSERERPTCRARSTATASAAATATSTASSPTSSSRWASTP